MANLRVSFKMMIWRLSQGRPEEMYPSETVRNEGPEQWNFRAWLL